MVVKNVPMQPIFPQSHLRYPLNRLLAKGGALRILRSLALYGDALSVSQLAGETGMTPQGIRLALDSLAGLQIVSVMGQGRSMLYKLAPTHPMTSIILQMFLAEKSHWDDLLQSLRDITRRFAEIEACWYYGSVARGEDLPASDLDIAIIVSSPAVETITERYREALHPLEAVHATSCSVVGIGLTELSAIASGNPWWAELCRDGKVIKGMPPERLLERQRKSRDPK
jgi:predicted nucleotidyltransferase